MCRRSSIDFHPRPRHYFVECGAFFVFVEFP
jgi:hypothetical protein